MVIETKLKTKIEKVIEFLPLIRGSWCSLLVHKCSQASNWILGLLGQNGKNWLFNRHSNHKIEVIIEIYAKKEVPKCI